MFKVTKKGLLLPGAILIILFLILTSACSPVQTSDHNQSGDVSLQTGDINPTPIPLATTAGVDQVDMDAGTPAQDNMVTTDFLENPTAFANPERGWYRSYCTDDMWDIDTLRSQGITMVLLKANLKEFTDKPISDAKLNEIQSAFDTARQNGLQVMFRAAYDFDGNKKCEPKQLSTILGHIAQLKSMFYQNDDILYCVQAGFLGPWGEWHSSYYGDPPSLEARKSVLFALMDAVPPTKAIQVRRPMFIRDIFQGEPGGSALTAATAFQQTFLSRTGYHDDALLSTQDESGTYQDANFSREDELNWVDNQDKYVPFVAESNQLTPYSNAQNAIYELNKLHAQIINAAYHPSVIAKWKTTSYGGMSVYDYITQRLGYRLILKDASLNADVRKGGALHLRLRFLNDGFANLINPRPFEVILSNGDATYIASVADDPRLWFRESGMITKDLYFSIPSGIASGEWKLYLNLPSAYESLRNNPLYSVRFANLGTWEEGTGYNLVKSDLAIHLSYGANAVETFRQITRDEAAALCTEK